MADEPVATVQGRREQGGVEPPSSPSEGIGLTTPDILLKKPAAGESNKCRLESPACSPAATLEAKLACTPAQHARQAAGQRANVSLSTSTTPSATQNAWGAGENPVPSALVRLEREDEEPPTLNSLRTSLPG
ncbi:Williams-Beuren syndrome critical region protein 25 [Rhodotorula toruloides ATCC 204091]|uniref:Williams-Beuren syndrome critical region protein 25 n=1 Tax=Rhodotorula toruloides TaxID=5286 RepID=A0A0K3CJU0_RHOTO|nr:Williams-Beuren syndrome critical region protein 25 [Rhodotorula toruloides ATCC 204091]PRQ74392.1 williams-Beuren syndrome critical region protein 25 [Rhodotorula toruloides]